MTDKPYQPWTPLINPVDLKTLGKLGEEANELGGITCRIVIQGMDEFNEKEQQSNRLCLEDEIADVEANIELVKRRFNLDRKRIGKRAAAKIPKLLEWHSMAGTCGHCGKQKPEHSVTCPAKPQDG